MTMPNTTLNLSIPEELKEMAIEQARAQHFSSTSDYLQHLVRTDAFEAEQRKKLSKFLEKGLNSGDAREISLEELSAFIKKVIKEA